MVLLGIVGAMVGVVTRATLGTSRGTSLRTEDLNSAQVALDVMSKLIRTATHPAVASGSSTVPTAFVTAGGTDISFYGYNAPGEGPSLIRFYESGSDLIEQVSPATNCVDPLTFGTTSQRTIATNLTSGQTIFTYYAEPTSSYPGGSPMPTPSTGTESITDPVTEPVEVGISLTVQSDSSVAATTASTQVQLPNMNVGVSRLPVTSC